MSHERPICRRLKPDISVERDDCYCEGPTFASDQGSAPQAKLIRGILTTFDEFSSATNAETVKGVMQGNAKAGYWNGSRPPFGYRTYVAERMLKKEKKKLEPDPLEAPIV